MKRGFKMVLSDISPVVTDALLKALVKLSPKHVTSMESLESILNGETTSTQLVIFVGYTKEENVSILKTLTKYVLESNRVVFASGESDSEIFVTDDYVRQLAKSFGDNSNVDYIRDGIPTDTLDSYLNLCITSNIDYFMLENVSSIGDETIENVFDTLQEMNEVGHSNIVVTLTEDEYASLPKSIVRSKNVSVVQK